jgi:flagellar basal-body rod protein FlgB
MIDSITNSGAIPVLERVLQFTEQRQVVLAHDMANLSTPNFQPSELDPKAFQAALAQAVDRRRSQGASESGPLEVKDTKELTFTPDGIQAHPQAANEGILFHDNNNRDLERINQHIAENILAHNTAIELIRDQFATLKSAIAERV